VGTVAGGLATVKVDAKARQRWKELGDKELAVRARQTAAQSLPLGDSIPSSTVEREPEGEAREPESEEHAGAEH
jgi:hypothetical protein